MCVFFLREHGQNRDPENLGTGGRLGKYVRSFMLSVKYQPIALLCFAQYSTT
jgi:hypothetical protein